MDFEGNFIKVNPEAEKLSGYKMGDIQKPNMYSLLVEEDRMLIDGKISKSLDTGRPDETPIEIRINTKDGQSVWVESKATFLYNRQGKPYAIQGIVRDITERKRMQKELEKHNDHLAIINRILRHDILNNQVVIDGALSLYRKNQDETLLKKVSDRVSKTISLINQMKEVEVAFSSDHNLQPYDVADIIKKVMEIYPFIAFTIKGNCFVMVDYAFYPVIDNIVRNAIVHGKTDKIDVTIESKNDFCEIRIADYGLGISNEIKTRIFEEGFKFEQSEGSGLGLYIVGKTIERYGGTVHVEDNKPKGTIFVLRLHKAK
jgi:PAS domain S-box-containing protein